MKELEERIQKDGIVKGTDILIVNSFLNHQMDPMLFRKMAKEWKRLFAGENVNKILTIEASGIALAVIAGEEFGCPVVFAKKGSAKNLADDVYTAKIHSFTHGNDYDALVSKKFLSSSDRVLIIDDFLAHGEAVKGLISICRSAGAGIVGAGIAVEKAFQGGHEELEKEGIRVCSLARVSSMDEKEGIRFLS